MRATSGSPKRETIFVLAVGILASVAIPLHGQEVRHPQDARPTMNAQNSEEDAQTQAGHPIVVGKAQITGYPDDWTHHRMLFTNPGTEEEAIRQGRHEEWLRTVNDPRYILHALKRHIPVQGPAAADVAEREALQASAAANFRASAAAQLGAGVKATADFRPGVWRNQPMKRGKVADKASDPETKEDWNVPATTGNSGSILGILSIGGAVTTGQVMPNIYPAKYTFNPNGTPSCPNDFLVYPTGVAGVTNNITTVLGVTTGGPGTPDIIAYNNLDTGLVSGVTSCGTILEGVFSLSVAPNPTVMWAYNTGGTATSSPVFSLDGSQLAFIQTNASGVAQLVLLKWSSPGNSATVGISVGGLLQIGASEMVNGNEYGYGVANLPLLGGLLTDYPVSTAPESDSCTGTITSSSYQNLHGGEGTGTAPTPHMCVITLSGSPKVTNSVPFVDYANGILYVGDDSGKLHKFTGLSFGEPGNGTGQAGSTAAIAEATPVTLSSSGSPLGAPVFDSVSGCVFVGDAAGFLYQVNSGITSGTKCNSATFSLNATSAQLANGTTNGILDAPLLNSSSQAVYVFVSSSAAFGGITSGSNAVDEFVPGFGAGALPTSAQAIGTGGSKLDLLDGDFDNVYYSSSNATGNLYAVGNTAVGGQGTLFQLPVTNNVLGAPTKTIVLNSGNNNTNFAYASPVMEFCNNAGSPCQVSGGQTTSGVDLIYFSVYKGTDNLFTILGNTNCSLTLAPGGCVFGIDVHNPATLGLYADYGLPGDGVSADLGFAGNPCWVTGGMVVDNASASLLDLNLIGAGSQMYFTSMNGNSVSTSSTYNPCQTPGLTGNVLGATQLGQGNLVL